MVHEHIYRNEGLNDINARKYITDLIEYIMFTFGFTSNQVSLKIDVSNIIPELDTLIPFGMLVNEINF